jgi:predicted MFS family arabinose efflux permease
MLAAFFVANALPEFLWSNFPPIVTIVASKYHIGDAAASLPIISFSVGTVLSAGIAGRIIDQRGYRMSTRVGLVMLAVFSLLRVIDGPFWLLVLAQGGIGAAFSFIAASTSSYVVDWFEERHVALVTGLCVTGLYVGLGSSMIVTPVLVSHFGFGGTMQITAAAAVLILLAGYPLIRQRRAAIPLAECAPAVSSWQLMKNRTLCLLFITSFLMGGAFSAVTSGLEPIWSGRGFLPEDAGIANGLFIFAGIAGNFLMPLLQGRLDSGRSVLILCALAALLLTYPLLAASSPVIGNAIAVTVGVFWAGSIPVCLTVMEKAAGIPHAGAASSTFWALNNLGSVALVWMFSEIMELWSWRVAAVVMLLLLLINQVAMIALPRDGRLAHKEQWQ